MPLGRGVKSLPLILEHFLAYSFMLLQHLFLEGPVADRTLIQSFVCVLLRLLHLVFLLFELRNLRGHCLMDLLLFELFFQQLLEITIFGHYGHLLHRIHVLWLLGSNYFGCSFFGGLFLRLGADFLFRCQQLASGRWIARAHILSLLLFLRFSLLGL